MKIADKKIKVLFVIDSLDIGGAEKLLSSTIKYLNKDNFGIAVIFLTGSGFLLKQAHMADIQTFGPVLINERNFLLAIYRILKYIRVFKCDIIHTHLFYSNIYGRIAAWLAGVPVVVSSLHNPDYTYEANSGIYFKIRKFLDRITGRRINDCFIAVSDAVKNDFLTNFGFDNIITLYNGIELGALESNRPILDKKGEITILNVGRLHPQKGQDVLIEAFNLLSNAYPNLKLLIAGAGQREEYLKNLTAGYGLTNKVEFLGKHSEIKKILNLADIFVLPSLYEGFGIALIEAMAFGIPVVATSVGGVNEIIEDNKDGILVKPGNALEIAQAVKGLIDQPALARKLALNARAKVCEKFDIRFKVKQLEAVYQKLISNKRCPVCGSFKIRKTLFGGYNYSGNKYDIVGCRKCGFMFLSPMPEEDVLNTIYQDSDYFDNYYVSENGHSGYIKAMHECDNDCLSTLEVIKNYKSGGKMLDVGCAAGRFLSHAREFGYNVYGVEPNKALADYANENMKINVLNRHFDQSCFSGVQFDIIYLADVLEHLPLLRPSLEIMRGRLNDDGILVLKQPLTYNFNLFNLFLKINMFFKQDRHSSNHPAHLWEFTASSLKKFLLDNNWQIVYWNVYETMAKTLPKEKSGGIKNGFYRSFKDISSRISNSRFLKERDWGDRVTAICRIN